MCSVSDDVSYERRAFFVCMRGFITARLRGEPCVVYYYREVSGCQKVMISEGYRVIGRNGSPLSLTQKWRRTWYSSRSCIKSCLLQDEGTLQTPHTHVNTQHTIHRSKIPGSIKGETQILICLLSWSHIAPLGSHLAYTASSTINWFWYD